MLYSYRILSASKQHCSVALKDALMMLIPRHERWPVLMSTQGYLIWNMRFINSRIQWYEMSSGMEDTVSEGLLLVDRGEQ
jgi:hypothetical protein